MKVESPFQMEVEGLRLRSTVDDVVIPNPVIRQSTELRDFLMEPDSAEPERPILSVYRGVFARRDLDLFGRTRYDVTVVLPGRLGRERNKTLSHYHNDFMPGLSYPEVYEVLAGTGHFILQRPPERGGPEVIVYEASEGEGILIPPNYGHVAINPSKETLVYSNLICSCVEPSLEEFRKTHGAAYYELYDGTLVRNPMYGWKVEPIMRRGDPSLHDVYHQFTSEPGRFRFLEDPTILARG